MIRRTTAAQLVCAAWLCLIFNNSSADLASSIIECDAIVNSDDDATFTLVTDDCPGVVGEIASSSWGASMVPGWRDELSYWELSELGYFESYYSEPVSTATGISLDTLDEIVAGLGADIEQVDKESLWERFFSWLRELLFDESPDRSGWFSEWLSKVQLPTSAIKIIFWVLSGITVIAAVVVIVREVRTARKAVPAGSAKSEKVRGVTRAHAAARDLTLKDVDDANLFDKPSVLVRLFLQRMEKLGLASINSACTHREAWKVAKTLEIKGVGAFLRVSESAERIRFGEESNRPPEIDDVVSDGIALINNLETRQV